MSARQLLVLIDGQTIGSLSEVSGLWSFRYADAWLDHPQRFALSPHLPLQRDALLDGASTRPVQWYFDNLLPEEGQRVLLAGDARIDAADAFGLLAWYGSESAGSLTLRLPDAQAEIDGGLHPLTDEALSARIHRMPEVPLTHAAVKRMSLAGAQHKLAVVLEADALSEPAGARPSTHILKPDHPDPDYPHSVANEWFVMRLAQRLGLDVPRVHRRYVPEPVYLIQRFDRMDTAGGIRRRHVVDACQLLGLDRGFKYAQGSIESLAALAAACRSPALARTRLFNWLVFNALAGNGDAHLKNLSFLVSHEAVQLAPHYDLLSTACYDSRAYDRSGWPDVSALAWPVLGARRFAELTPALLIDAAGDMGIAAATARRLLQRQVGNIQPLADALYREVESENVALLAARPGLAATLAGEMRCLRAIVHGVIRDMATRLGA